MKLAVFVTLVCAAHSTLLPEHSWQLDSWERQFSWRNDFALFDKDQQPITVMNMTLTVYGDEDPHQTSFGAFVIDNLGLLQDYPVEPVGRDVQMQQGLPLKFNMTRFEIIATGPEPLKKTGVDLRVLLYSDKQHQHQAMAMLKSMGQRN